MAGSRSTPTGRDKADPASSAPGGLLDLLSVAAVVLGADGRIVLWSPPAEELFGYTAAEALGRYASELLVHEEDLDLVLKLFDQVMNGGGTWAGVFPVKHRNGDTRLVEFRNMRLEDDEHALYALGLASDQATLRQVERDLALSARLISQAPFGLAVMDTDLRYLAVNPALERINGVSEAGHVGRHVQDVVPLENMDQVEAGLREVLESGTPALDKLIVGRTPADPHHVHAWSVSSYRLETPSGKVLGLASSVVDVTDRYRATKDATRSRERLALIADASVLVGTTLDLEQTAQELADLVVPDLADIAAVDVLDAVLEGRTVAAGPLARTTTVFRALALKADAPGAAVEAADPPGKLAQYDPDRLVTHCVATGSPILVPEVGEEDLRRIARSAEAAAGLARAGLHSYLTVPLTARGEVLGALDLKRLGNPEPFNEDDVILACDLAARAAVSIDNARWYQRERSTALTLQRRLLPRHGSMRPGLEIAFRYQPAEVTAEVGGDWFDVIPLSDDRTALVVGDVMGSGINAAATMGQLSNATRALADVGMDPAEILHHLDRSTTGLDQSIATCVYADYDPVGARCRIALAGHLPPFLVRPGRGAQLLELPTGAPLGVGGISFDTTEIPFAPGDWLVLYTDGLVETRRDPIDSRLDTMLGLLTDETEALEETCDRLLTALRQPDGRDDVALLIVRARQAGAQGAAPS